MWEYKIIMRTRRLAHTGIGVIGVAVEGEFSPNGEEMLAQLAALGRDRWELVAVTTRSSLYNSPMTSEETWIFKRPLLE